MIIELNNERTYEKASRKTLVIAPHADDEVLGCFAYINKEAKKGNIVDVIIMAVGEYVSYSGLETNPDDKIEEIKHCHGVMGIRKTMIFSNKESKLDSVNESEIVRFFDEILKEEYDTIFVPYPSRHIDHRVTYNAAMASFRLKEGKKPENEIYLYEYPFIQNFDNIQGGAVYMPLTIDDLNQKMRAFKIYKSQVKTPPSPLNSTGISTLATMRGMEIGFKYAEKYYLQTKILKK